MVAENYACAYKEVIEVLKYTKREDVNKIPKYRILLWKTNMKKDYDFKIDKSKTLEEQNLSDEAKAIIANIFKKYWATDYQKERIEAKEKYDIEQMEKEKCEKYNPDDIFKNRKQTISADENISNIVAMVEYKETIFKKIINEKMNECLFNIKRILNRQDYEESLYKRYGNANKLQKYNLRLLFIADTHNCLRNDNEVLNYMKKQNDYDYCILLGDHSASDLEEILSIIPLNKICGVLGNHDSWEKYDNYGINNINGKIISIKGIRIAGIGGSFKYKNINEYALYTHEESVQIANNIAKADILVTHDKAFIEDNHNPSHDGLKGITEYIYKNHIALHIHGHLHEEKEELLKNGSKSICLYMVKLLEL